LLPSAGLLEVLAVIDYRAVDGCGPLSFETGELAMKRANAKLTGLALLAGVMLFGTANAEAGGYFYRARSFYVTPPIYANLPVFGQPPIVVYEPVVTYPAPVAGYYGPVAAPVAMQTQAVVPAGAVVPAPVYVGGPYTRTVVRRNGVVRFAERW
jgi:hypothetical protein